MSLKDEAEDYYKKHYGGRGLAPKHVIGLKEAITKALRKKEKPSVAAKAFLKEKGIVLTDGAITTFNKKEKSTKEKTTKKDKDKKVEKLDKAVEKHARHKDDAEHAVEKLDKDVKAHATHKMTVVPLPPSEVSKMDRKSLKATIAQLKDAGVEIEYSKKDEDDVLMRKINDAMSALPSPQTLKLLESVDPAKLKDVLKKDCLGIFIDLRSPSCQACPDNESCMKQWLENLKGDFSVFKGAMAEIKTEEAAALVSEEDVKASTKKAKKAKESKSEDDEPEPEKKAKSKKVVWDPERFIAVLDVKLKDIVPDKAHPTYSTIKAILDKVPGNFKELRDLVEEEWEYDSDETFVNDWVNGMRRLGVLKLESDLDEDERAAYVEAGVLS